MNDLLIELRKYFETELDQWDMFKIDTAYGKVYTVFSREILYGTEASYDYYSVKPESKVFWRVGVEKPPMRGITPHDFDGPVAALNHISNWLKEGAIVRSVEILSKDVDKNAK